MAGRATTRGTVLIAGTANLLVGAVKLAAGIMVGSSAMLAEAAHSAADTLNQALLLTSVHRGERPADPRHPFGYGQERYFWLLLAAFGIFIAGAADRAEDVADEIDQRLASRLSLVPHVFLDPTQASPGSRPARRVLAS